MDSMEQYDRRNNIEITEIPDNIEDKNIEDCHRIGKSKGNSKKTIVRLVNRKFCKQILYNRLKFKNFDGSGIDKLNTKIFVNENLTKSNHRLAFNRRKRKREKLILKTYSSNGIFHILQIHGKKPIKVFNQSKVFKLKNWEGMCCVLLFSNDRFFTKLDS